MTKRTMIPLLLAGLVGGSALAQPPLNPPAPGPEGPSSARRACYSSAMNLCPDQVKARDRAGVRACLIRNFDKVTPDCAAAMKALRERMQKAGESG